MKKIVLFSILVCGLSFAGSPTCGEGESQSNLGLRTGKAIGATLESARELAYLRFLNNLGRLGRECLESEKGRLAFGSIQSQDGVQDEEAQTFWASVIVETACCK